MGLAQIPALGEAERVQYTPTTDSFASLTEKGLLSTKVTSHDPDGVNWINDWPSWDGQVFTTEGLKQKICGKGVDNFVGNRDLFDELGLFANNMEPTLSELDFMHTHYINHWRKLVGLTGEEHQIKNDRCLSAQAAWSSEHLAENQGPNCQGPSCTCSGAKCRSDCGTNFIPSAEAQAASSYVPSSYPTCKNDGVTETIFRNVKADIPWSIKINRGFCALLGHVGYNSPLIKPFFFAKRYGLYFKDNGKAMIEARIKWSYSDAEEEYETWESQYADIRDTSDINDINDINDIINEISDDDMTRDTSSDSSGSRAHSLPAMLMMLCMMVMAI